MRQAPRHQDHALKLAQTHKFGHGAVMLLTLLIAASTPRSTPPDASMLVLVATRQTEENSSKVRRSGFHGGSPLEVALVQGLKRWKVPLKLYAQGPECRIQASTKIGEALQQVQGCRVAFALLGELHAHRRRVAGLTGEDGRPSRVHHLQLNLQLIDVGSKRVVSAINHSIVLPLDDPNSVALNGSQRLARRVTPHVAKDLFAFLGRPLPTALRALLRAEAQEQKRQRVKREREKAQRQQRIARHKQVLKACAADDAAACAKAAFNIKSGYGSYRDAERALEYQSRACALGHRPSCEQPIPAPKAKSP